MRANILAKMAEDHFRMGYVVSHYPDFPHLITAPDVLIGGNGKLLGFFLPSKAEISNPNRLLVRLALCRLGLPSHLVCVLIEPGTLSKSNPRSQQNWNSIFTHFDAVSEAKKNKKDVQPSACDGTFARMQPAFAEIRQLSMKRYAALWNFSVSHEKTDVDRPSNARVINGLVANFGFCESQDRSWLSESTSETLICIRREPFLQMTMMWQPYWQKWRPVLQKCSI